MWDLAAPPQVNPLRSFEEHKREVYCVAWNGAGKRDLLLSASWDDTIKLWAPGERPHALRTFAEHAYCVYAATWNPRHPEVFASASGDCTLKARPCVHLGG